MTEDTIVPPEKLRVECCRCRNKHFESERVGVPSKKISGARDLVCPRCRCRSYYRLDQNGMCK